MGWRIAARRVALVVTLASACPKSLTAEPVYRYDAATGRCRAPDGSEGLNALDPEAWRRRAPVTDIECGDFRGTRINITYRTFEHANLRGADFSGNGCYETTFRQSDLTGAKLARIAGNGCQFEASDLTRVDLRGARIARARLHSVILTQAVFDRQTELPFTREEALARGMLEAP